MNTGSKKVAYNVGGTVLGALVAPMTGGILRRHFAQADEPSGTVTPAEARERYGRAARPASAS